MTIYLAMHKNAAVWLFISVAPVLSAADDALPQGEYLFHSAGCATCHTQEDNKGPPLAGGRALKTTFGTFYSSNITPDPDTGIGRWSEADFRRALREGISPEGKHYYPAFPFTSYSQLTDADLRALWKYLLSRQPVRQANRPHELPWYLRARPLLSFWKMLYFRPGVFQPLADKPPAWNRGAYLVKAVAHCGECHTPRHFFGGFKEAQYLAGNPHGVDDTKIPNITPDRKTGIGKWSASDIADYLETGMTPDGDFAGDLMADVIDNSTSVLTREDRRAIASYLKSLPAVESVERSPKK
jgi:mono/diheme cytochrome c family protein